MNRLARLALMVLAALLLVGIAVRPLVVEEASSYQDEDKGKQGNKKRKKKKRKKKSSIARLAERKKSNATEGLVVLVDPLETPRPVARPGAPNVVVVIGCTVRKDQISAYGGLPQTTPFLQSVADGGVRFADLVAAAPWTRPGSTAVITGQHPVSIGMIEPGNKRSDRRLSRSVTLLSEFFRGAGYNTAGLTANPNLNALFNFHQGFDAYHEASGLWRDGMAKVGGDTVVPRALELVSRQKADGRPLYLQVMLIDAHAPIKASKSHIQKFMPPEDIGRLAKYRYGLHQFDHWVGELDKGLHEQGYTEENTIFVVVADHGEGLRVPSHHGKGHGTYMYPSVTNLPWLMKGKGVAPGHAIEGMASQVDITPTLLGLADIEGYVGPGRDWSAQVVGHGSRTDRVAAFTDTWFRSTQRSAIQTEHFACQHDFAGGSGKESRKKRRARRNQRKDWRDAANPEATEDADAGGEFLNACYDRRRDPSWSSPLRSRNPDGLEAELKTWRDARVLEYEAFPDVSDAEVGDELRAQLEALGYAE